MSVKRQVSTRNQEVAPMSPLLVVVSSRGPRLRSALTLQMGTGSASSKTSICGAEEAARARLFAGDEFFGAPHCAGTRLAAIG